MSRLRQEDYLVISKQLKYSRKRHDPAFVRLDPTDQFCLTVYFGLDAELTTKTAAKYRRRAISSDASLPQRAGKALKRFEADFQDGPMTVYGAVQLNEALFVEALRTALEDAE